jgi:hypothetical protein
MCACGNAPEETSNDAEQSETEPSIETISIGSLLDALDNQAKAELNIGKKTTMFVSIKNIYSDYCEVWHVIEKQTSKVYMAKETLAKLRKGEFLAISAIVDNVEYNRFNANLFSYVFNDGEIQDITLFDDYVRKAISYSSASYFVARHSDFLVKYVSDRGTTFMMDDIEISEFIVGAWHYDFSNEDYIPLTSKCTFYSNGTVEWKSEDQTYTNEWGVTDGQLKSFIGGGGGYVYKVTEDVFVFINGHNAVFVRI